VPTLPVDWPDLADPATLPVLLETEHFRVHVAAEGNAEVAAVARRWSTSLESLRAIVESRLGRPLAKDVVHVTFAAPYPAACPARGLASPRDDGAAITVFADEETSAAQVRGVLAHELVHVVTMRPDFAGDGILTEGVANWGAGEFMLEWQGFPSWAAAVRAYVAAGSYVSVADPGGLMPAAGEDCLARRDRVYNARAAFTGWLVDRVGLDTVLAMPAEEVTVRTEEGRTRNYTQPDYEAATGFAVEELETMWLAEVTGRL
jgi:hypothetical protein